MLYFAYGSNMDEEDLKKWCQKRKYAPIKPITIEVAVLKDWKLVFNHYSSTREGGVANIEKCEGEEVWGLLMELTQEDFEKIKEKEGAPNFYKEKFVTVQTRGGETKNALTFVVVHPSKKFVPPTREYLNLLIRSAERYNFPLEYIQKLRSVETK